MQLQSLKLHNIRSYTDEEIIFPKGSVLLSGDIGSGKSSILLSIEFALFGVRKPDLTGSALLRKGEKSASVELHFKIDNKSIIIKRTIKKSGKDIKQDAGFIIIDDVKTEGTPVELKSKILELLGYPKDLLTKHKDIIYRYTVYTPQEEMKSILFEDSDLRLNTLRKVFGIDKYKRIRENCLLYARDLRGRIKTYQGQIFDLEEKKKIKLAKKQDINELEKRREKTKDELSNINSIIIMKKSNISELKDKIIILNDLNKELEILEANLKNDFSNWDKSNKNQKMLKTQLDEIKESLPEEIQDRKILKKDILRLEEEIYNVEMEIKELNKKIIMNDTEVNNSGKIINQVSELKNCPLCKQGVSENHKDHIKKEHSDLISDINKKQEIMLKKLEKLEDSLKSHKEAKKDLLDEEKFIIIQEINLKGYEEKKKAYKKEKNDSLLHKEKIAKGNQDKILINKSLKNFKETEKHFTELDDELSGLLEKEKGFEKEYVRAQTSLDDAKTSLKSLQEEISLKNKVKQKIKETTKVTNWLTEFFQNLMQTMEKHRMSTLYREFNEYFVECFSSLIDDQSISARLDEQFSVAILQNGYDTELSNLSGGEKTSVALAYRLAFNKVTNDFIEEIKTKDLIILDEPTDGFSEEQLDRVRDVLENINISQIIVVSHESKIETFVDNILRVSKTEHISTVSSISF